MAVYRDENRHEQMIKNRDGTYSGNVTPTRFQFAAEKLVYPLKITQISVKNKTEALFYVQAPYKVDLPGDFSFQRTWVPMLSAAGKKPNSKAPGPILPGRGTDWLDAIQNEIPNLLARN